MTRQKVWAKRLVECLPRVYNLRQTPVRQTHRNRWIHPHNEYNLKPAFFSDSFDFFPPMCLSFFAPIVRSHRGFFVLGSTQKKKKIQKCFFRSSILIKAKSKAKAKIWIYLEAFFSYLLGAYKNLKLVSSIRNYFFGFSHRLFSIHTSFMNHFFVRARSKYRFEFFFWFAFFLFLLRGPEKLSNAFFLSRQNISEIKKLSWKAAFLKCDSIRRGYLHNDNEDNTT